MPAKARSSRYADRAALQSLGLFEDTSKLRAIARRGNNTFDHSACEIKIISDLLPHQKDFVTDFDHRMVALCGGFGSGKSFAAVTKSILLCFRSPGFTHYSLSPQFHFYATLRFLRGKAYLIDMAFRMSFAQAHYQFLR